MVFDTIDLVVLALGVVYTESLFHSIQDYANICVAIHSALASRWFHDLVAIRCFILCNVTPSPLLMLC